MHTPERRRGSQTVIDGVARPTVVPGAVPDYHPRTTKL